MGVFEDVIMKPGSAEVSRKRERRSRQRMSDMRASRTGMSASLWELELVPARALPRLVGEIDALAARAAEPNIFFTPHVLEAAWPRLNSLLAPSGAWMACLWETLGERRNLRLFMPMTAHGTGFPSTRVLSPLSNVFMPLGTPLVDADTLNEACETLLQLLGDPALTVPRIVDFTHLRAGGPVATAIEEAAVSLGLPHARSRRHERAALFAQPTDGTGDPLRAVASSKLSRDLARRLRRLEEDGPVTFHFARKEEEVLDAFEAFVSLELKGWKGRRSTALYNHKRIATFSREITARLAGSDACEIVELRHETGDGRAKVLGSLILFGKGAERVTWKMAFDEEAAKASPGLQVMGEATRKLLALSSFEQADSLAIEDHAMMNRIWPHRIAIHDLAVAVDPSAQLALEQMLARKARLDGWKDRARELAKKVGLR